MKGYSVDLWRCVLLAVERGMPRQDVVHTLGVSLGTIKRLLVKQRRGDQLAPRSPPGRPAAITSDQYSALQAQLETYPDATFAQHADIWNTAHGTTLSQWTLGRAIRRMGWTRKKNGTGE